MAFYRCGGGSGIPSQVNTDMNNVLNKKFSTSGQTYPPLEWADDVNLLGLLEEKTASGAIANITDGADGVPLKNWLVTLPASLDGYTEVNGYKGGKNFLPIAVDYLNYTQTKNDMTISVLANGKVKFNGTATANTDFTFYSASVPSEPHLFVRNGTYTFSNIGSGSVKMVVSGGNNNGFPYREIANGSYTGTVTDETKPFNYIIFRISSGVTLLNVEIEPMLEVGSTATAYEAYEAPTTYTAQLGRTIYGGTADIVTGEGEDCYAKGSMTSTYLSGLSSSYIGYEASLAYFGGHAAVWVRNWNWQTAAARTAGGIGSACNHFPISFNNSDIFASQYRVYFDVDGKSISSVSDFIDYVEALEANNDSLDIVYELATGADFTFTPITPTPDTALGVNNFWADEGDSDVTYRSSDTTTPVPVVPTLITKTITENGTYSAEDDNADGYSEVTVNVQGGSTPFVPQFSETLIADNTSHATSFTLTEDYGNYDMVKIVWYESASSSGFLYTTPDILDEIFSIGVGKLCVNKPSTNYYACYTKSGLTWTRSNQRVIDVHEIYGVTFTNCTMTATDLYKRGASTTTKYAITSQTSLKDYDLFMMSSIHATDGSETMPATWLYQYPPENMSGAFSCPVPAVLQEYNANDEAFVISEYGMTAARYFMVQGITFTPSTSNLLSMGGLTSSNEEPDEPENNEEEEEE